ncbi:hypothetical protein BS47DRAFT_1056622 [Hydnum rufescens UP504]|uniref:Uncharacterized protein n=1 Tax=Hydnum rufescens UP504 TaxID=1448309 RepID=A0A9P6AUX3_9AGAM|nr:hypothetical protein BS47DRAFT_1056622 [Hydnum rufescens UP504]
MPSVNSAIKGRSQRHPSKPYQIPRSRSLVSNREGSQTTHSSLSSRSSYSQTSQVPIPSTSSNFTAGHNSCLDSSRCRERPRKVRKLRRNPATPVEPPVPEPPHCAHPSPRVKSPETPAEHLPPIQYIPRDKPLLASANDIYAKDLVAQSVAMVQEIWLLPPDPPLPLGIYLQGHGPPSHTAPPNYEPPQPVVVHGPVALEAQHIATPPFLPTPSPTNSTSDTTMEESSDEASNASTSPTLAGPPPPLTHAEPQHQHHYPAPYAPHVTMGPAQQAATFTNNLLYFIHEVVRRSRTTCTTLEVAMCYIGAVRPNVRQVLGDRENVCRQARVLRCHPCQIDVHRVYNSPLHDARRTFLASLVLASKFQQDRAYSNKAWAKLSGLPAQEVTRCETALGNALQWRLWVGRHVQVAPELQIQILVEPPFFSLLPKLSPRYLGSCLAEDASVRLSAIYLSTCWKPNYSRKSCRRVVYTPPMARMEYLAKVM